MKRFILFLLLSIFVINTAAQNRFIVHNIEGTGFIKNNNQWIPLSIKDTVFTKTVIKLEVNTKIKILDPVSNRIYFSEEKGEQTVLDIIIAAKRGADRIAHIMNSQIKELQQNNTRINDYSYATSGVSHRGVKDNDNTFIVYSSLCRILKDDTLKDYSNGQLIAYRTFIDDEEYFYSVENKSESSLYVNIIHINQGIPSVAFDLGYTYDEPFLEIRPKEIKEVKQFVFLKNKQQRMKSIVFGFSEPFDTQELKLLLKNRTIYNENVTGILSCSFLYE